MDSQLLMAAAQRDKRSAPELPESRPQIVLPDVWQLTHGITRYPWQEGCITRWKKKGKGTVKVVTGGGKTLLRLRDPLEMDSRNTLLDKELRVVIVVPTIVLMHQWYDTLIEHGNLPEQAIGRLGGGYDDGFENHRVLIAVLTSASKQLSKLVRKAKVGKHLLLIADECHRTGAKEMSEVFKTERKWSLGSVGHPRAATMTIPITTPPKWGANSARSSSSSIWRTQFGKGWSRSSPSTTTAFR